MPKFLFPLLTSGLLLAGAAAHAQASEVQALTKRLNELMRDEQEPRTEAVVSLAGCGVRETVRKYRSANNPTSMNVSVSKSKDGSSWGVRTNDKVEFELSLGLDWSEIGAVSYQAQQREKDGRRYYELKLLRRPAADGKTAGLDSIDLPLYTQNEQEVAALVRRLGALRRQCSGQRG
ncbi:hypothetical protein [Hymenobacter sp. CRA2]|uniref:hypothetical protein n=1 Tax=Hymenobacter sp. CRA2 TaxID=1955620 RepID=UPI00098EA7AB|nr:hypothetical protein [Hymenobacter sp. CRA2]OON67796.1 hypothetical protein B0919_16555 [Hymenobacter sp. CRA2]